MTPENQAANAQGNNQEGVRKVVTKGAIEVSRVYTSDYQKEGTQTAELKQTVTTKSYYPSKSVRNDLQDNPFPNSDFGFEEKEYSQERVDVAWIDVPNGKTKEEVKAVLSANPNATIYRIVANHPIFHSGQLAQMERISKDDSKPEAQRKEEVISLKNQIANRQVLRYSADAEDGSYKKDQIILDQTGKPQYKATFYSGNAKADEDRRTSSPSDYFATPEILAEMHNSASVVEKQEIGG